MNRRVTSLTRLGLLFLVVGGGVGAGFVSAHGREPSPRPEWSAFTQRIQPNQSIHVTDHVTIELRPASGQARGDR